MTDMIAMHAKPIKERRSLKKCLSHLLYITIQACNNLLLNVFNSNRSNNVITAVTILTIVTIVTYFQLQC